MSEIKIITQTRAEDLYGNAIFRNGSNIYLVLKNSKTTHCLGTINAKNKKLVCDVSRYTAHYRDFRGYVINAYVLQHAKLFDFVEIKDELGIYEFSKEELLSECELLNTKKGMESFLLIPEDFLHKSELPF